MPNNADRASVATMIGSRRDVLLGATAVAGMALAQPALSLP